MDAHLALRHQQLVHFIKLDPPADKGVVFREGHVERHHRSQHVRRAGQIDRPGRGNANRRLHVAPASRHTGGNAGRVVLRGLSRDAPFWIGLGAPLESVAQGLEEKSTFTIHLARILTPPGRSDENHAPLARTNACPAPSGTTLPECARAPHSPAHRYDNNQRSRRAPDTKAAR